VRCRQPRNRIAAMSASGTFYGEDLRNSVLKIDLIHRLPGSR
jgi:hypothetical protein